MKAWTAVPNSRLAGQLHRRAGGLGNRTGGGLGDVREAIGSLGRSSGGDGGGEAGHKHEERSHGVWTDHKMLVATSRIASSPGPLQHALAAGHGAAAAGIDLHRLI